MFFIYFRAMCEYVYLYLIKCFGRVAQRLKFVSRHILTNVGRVAARDSSRVSATVNDLFTALCEDDSIYGLFRSMRGEEISFVGLLAADSFWI